jgi:molecular chaperone GrpE
MLLWDGNGPDLLLRLNYRQDESMPDINGKPNVEAPEVQQEPGAPEDTAGNEQRQNLSTTPSTAPASSGDLEKLRAERDTLLDRLARTQAEFENVRKRIEREQQEFKNFALANTLKSLLPVLDSFDWALQTPAQNLDEFRGGVDLIRKQLHDTLGKLGLQPIPARGEPFDPQVHEAVEVVDAGATPDQQVAEELRRGYKLHDRLLRPAMVAVARNRNR